MRRFGAALALLVVAGVACSDEGSPPREVQESPAPGETPAVPEDLVGTYARDLTLEEKEAAGASLEDPPKGLPLGALRLTIEPDGVAFIVHADQGDETVELEVTGDRFEITGGSYCEDPAASANYRWTINGSTLVTEPIDVDCPDRQAVLDGEWTRTS